MATIIRKKSMSRAPFRICVLGASGVGKTAISVRFVARRFLSHYGTGGDMVYEKTVCLDGQYTMIRIQDFPGTDILDRVKNDNFVRESLDKANAVMIVFSINDEDSWKLAKQLQLLIQSGPKLRSGKPVLLLANKRELGHMRRVSSVEVQRCALQHENVNFCECSAAEATSQVDEAFHTLVRMVQKCKEKRQAKKERKPSLVHFGSPKLIRAGFRRFSTQRNLDI